MADSDRSDQEQEVRHAIEQSRSGAPATGAVVRDRFSADEVFQRIIAAADEEITSGSRELFFSSLAAGFAVTITFLLYSSMTGSTGGDPILSALLYPLGFIYIIIGGYQLYTENTLPPVALTLERLSSIPALFRHWVIVLAGNFAGGAIGAAALAWGGVFSPETSRAALAHAQHGIQTPAAALFFKAAFAGLIVAGVVWMVYASQDTISQLVIVYMAFLAIPLGDLFHVVVSFTEMTYLSLVGDLDLAVGISRFVVPVLLGNTFGGIVLVTVVNYFQTTERRLESARFEGADRQLSVREWLFGRLVGRSYVSMINTARTVVPNADGYRVLVPIVNPRTESKLVELACTLASQHPDAVVHVVHIVQTPLQASMSYDHDHQTRIVAESEKLMEGIRETIRSSGVSYETSTIVSHRSFQEMVDAANRVRADLVVLGWGADRPWTDARTDRPINELIPRLSSDVLVLKDRGHDASRILLPTAGGPHSHLSADVAKALHSTIGSAITLLHIVDSPNKRETGEQFLADWATKHDLEDAVHRVEVSGNKQEEINRIAADHSWIILGATQEPLLSRLVSNSLYFDVVDEVGNSVLLVEQASEPSIFERLLGWL